MRYTKAFVFAVDFDRFVSELKAVAQVTYRPRSDAVELCRLASQYNRAAERACNVPDSSRANRASARLEAEAAKHKLTVRYPGLWPELVTQGGSVVRIPANG